MGARVSNSGLSMLAGCLSPEPAGEWLFLDRPEPRPSSGSYVVSWPPPSMALSYSFVPHNFQSLILWWLNYFRAGGPWHDSLLQIRSKSYTQIDKQQTQAAELAISHQNTRLIYIYRTAVLGFKAFNYLCLNVWLYFLFNLFKPLSVGHLLASLLPLPVSWHFSHHARDCACGV